MTDVSEKLKEVVLGLTKFRVDATKLSIVYVGGNEMLLGRISQKKGEELTLDQVHRFIRLTQASSQGLSVQFLIGDLDMYEGGPVTIKGWGYIFTISNGTPETQLSYYELLLDFYEKKEKMNKAASSGLVLPPEPKIIGSAR